MKKRSAARVALAATFLLAFGGLLAAQSADPAPSPADLRRLVPGLTPQEAAQLAKTGEVISDYSGKIETRIAPPFSGVDAMVKDLEQTQGNVGLELLFTAQLPPGFRDRSDFWLKTYNAMRSVSTLKGIKYYSADRNQMRIFYYDAYAIPSPDKRNIRLPDPLVTSIPEKSHIYTFHKDSSFGNYVMDVNYDVGPTAADPKYIRMSLTNATTMFYTIVPIAAPKHLQIDLVVVPEGNTLLFYSNFIANSPSVFGLRKCIDESFSNRIKALFNWFYTELKDQAAAGS